MKAGQRVSLSAMMDHVLRQVGTCTTVRTIAGTADGSGNDKVAGQRGWRGERAGVGYAPLLRSSEY